MMPSPPTTPLAQQKADSSRQQLSVQFCPGVQRERIAHRQTDIIVAATTVAEYISNSRTSISAVHLPSSSSYPRLDFPRVPSPLLISFGSFLSLLSISLLFGASHYHPHHHHHHLYLLHHHHHLLPCALHITHRAFSASFALLLFFFFNLSRVHTTTTTITG